MSAETIEIVGCFAIYEDDQVSVLTDQVDIPHQPSPGSPPWSGCIPLILGPCSVPAVLFAQPTAQQTGYKSYRP